MYDEKHFTRDAATVSFDDSADGITVDDGEAQFDWDEVETVTIDNPPHADAFESKQFYKLPATVAKPIPQPYSYGEDSVWLKKPREELKKAAWSLDNAPWTMGHPETGMVKDVDDVHGFWRNPRYLDALDDLDSDLHIPTDDEEAKDFVEENGDVSVGFYNRVARTDEYDGVVGGSDSEDIEVEGYQTNMLFDHVASVGLGRCSSEAGCGIDSDDRPVGDVDTVATDSFKRETSTTESDETVEGTSMEDNRDAQHPRTIEGTWYAVPPEDTTGDEPKFPIENCSDVDDAWKLRGHGEGLKIEQSTLEQRIKDRADELGCNIPDEGDNPSESEDSVDGYSIDGCGCGCGSDNTDTNTMDIDFDDLSIEAALAKVSAQNDGVSERLDELREAEATADVAQDAADELDLDSVDDLTDTVSMLKEQKDKLEERVDELQRPQMKEDAEFIAERTDRFGDDADEVMDALDSEPETVADKRELVEELTEGYDEQTANAGDSGGSDTSEVESTGKYAKTPW